jgi:hypothetical protein
MAVPADSQYGYDRPWQLLAETIAGDRAWENNSPPWYPPVTPSLSAEQMIPPRYGYRTTELTIMDVLDNVFSRLQSSPVMATESDDWSGQQGGYEATMRPTGAGGMAVT